MSPTDPPVLSLTGLTKSFGDNHVLRGIDFSARRGEVIALIGPSGSGKTTVLQNIIEGPVQVQKISIADATADAERLLDRVGLLAKRDSYPFELSGGQQQRVGIVRALALKPDLLLFDEPTSALDPELVGEVLSVIRELAHEGWTMVIVTHELAFARQVATEVVFMDGGVVVERGVPEQLLTAPREERTKQFLRRILNQLD